MNTVYLTRHGESIYNTEERIGGNSGLSHKGDAYSKKLFEYMSKNEGIALLKIYTSELIRTKQTAKHFPDTNKTSLSFINEINAGDFEDYTYDEIKKNNPVEYENRKLDKFNYRYPNGESYKDLKSRVTQIFKFIHQDFYYNQLSLIVCHNAVLRIIYGILMNVPDEDIPYINIPLHTLFKFELIDNNYKVTMIELD